MRRRNGEEVTQCLADANEEKGDHLRHQEEGEREMDDHNNSVGMELGAEANSYEDCKSKCMDAVRSGRTINEYKPGTTPAYDYK